MVLEPIGRVISEIKRPILLAGKSGLTLQERMDKVRAHHRKIRDGQSELLVFDRWAPLLDGIEGFSHILVLYWPHLIDPQRRRTLEKVHPMGRQDLPEQGIFATCSPARPNPVLVSAVRLVKRQGNILTVQGLEAVDNSPIIDIKPYVTSYYGPCETTVPDWMAQIQREMAA
ncbi:MAG: tRNA (N6-threonylcarbamoyladenosine(37)-N6)-methyltransferase TrmO [Desulfobacterales bacterium]|nr:tRNA (N6-threonylcarbamoyladenosine(37)-N6)-methyltransferase TrmO [Desulfobacterales bacterium]